MSKLIRLLICLFALGILSTLLWPQRAAAYPLAACSAAVTVTNPNDSGAGSLRQALADVCSGGTVDFATGLANQTITLTSAELAITKTVTITNPNAANLKVSGNNARRVFSIQSGVVVTMSNLSIISGTGFYSNGGGVYNLGTLTLNNSVLSGHSAYYGGGIYNQGILTLDNSILNNNSTPDWDGGGIYNDGILKVSNSTFSYNTADYQGGGIYNHNKGALTVTNSSFNNNTAHFGGGIDNESIIPFTITIVFQKKILNEGRSLSGFSP